MILILKSLYTLLTILLIKYKSLFSLKYIESMKNFHSFSKFSSFSIQFKILENKGLFIKRTISLSFFNSHSYRLDFLVYSLEFIIYLIISIFCPSEENIVFEPFFRANKYRGVLRCVDLFWVQFIIGKRFI